MHQIGVYGRLNDDAEVLLFIMQDERGIEVPASSVNADFEIEIAAPACNLEQSKNRNCR